MWHKEDECAEEVVQDLRILGGDSVGDEQLARVDGF
jgi:hypothetical protein